LQNDIRGVDSRLHQRGLAPFPRKAAGCQDGRMAEWQGESGMWKVRPGPAPAKPSSSSVMSTNKINVICVEGCNDCIIEVEYTG